MTTAATVLRRAVLCCGVALLGGTAGCGRGRVDLSEAKRARIVEIVNEQIAAVGASNLVNEATAWIEAVREDPSMNNPYHYGESNLPAVAMLGWPCVDLETKVGGRQRGCVHIGVPVKLNQFLDIWRTDVIVRPRSSGNESPIEVVILTGE
jgi:hypothetical protein